MNLESEVIDYRSRTLRAFWDSEAVKEAWQNLEVEITRQWKRAADTQAREACWLKLQLLEDFVREVRTIIDRPLTHQP